MLGPKYCLFQVSKTSSPKAWELTGTSSCLQPFATLVRDFRIFVAVLHDLCVTCWCTIFCLCALRCPLLIEWKDCLEVDASMYKFWWTRTVQISTLWRRDILRRFWPLSTRIRILER